MPEYEVRIRFKSPKVSVQYREMIVGKFRKTVSRIRWFNDPTREIKLVGVTFVERLGSK